MARSYDVAAAAFIAGAPAKWVDNLLSRHRIVGVEQHRQGVTRRVPLDAIVVITTVWILVRELELSVSAAVALAHRLTTAEDGRLTCGEGTVTVTVDRESLRAFVHARLADAVESAPRRRRGRPPGSRNGPPET